MILRTDDKPSNLPNPSLLAAGYDPLSDHQTLARRRWPAAPGCGRRGLVTGKAEVSWIYNDGGRRASGLSGPAGDCVARSIAIATGDPYERVHKELTDFCHYKERFKNPSDRSDPDNGVYGPTARKFLTAVYGWEWKPTLFVGSRARTYFTANDLPRGRLVVSTRCHFAAFIDHVLQDTWESTRGGSACVFGFFFKPWHPISQSARDLEPGALPKVVAVSSEAA